MSDPAQALSEARLLKEGEARHMMHALPGAVLAWAQERYPKFVLPNPLVPCTRCWRHAAFYMDPSRDHGYVCGVCGPRASIFTLPVPWYDRRQVAADVALKDSGVHDLLGVPEPRRFEGEDS